jgi:hypothetical protein
VFGMSRLSVGGGSWLFRIMGAGVVVNRPFDVLEVFYAANDNGFFPLLLFGGRLNDDGRAAGRGGRCCWGECVAQAFVYFFKGRPNGAGQWGGNRCGG